MVNVEEIAKKLLQQFKDNHQKSISEDNLCSKLIAKNEDIDVDDINKVKEILVSNGITITESMPDIVIDDK